MASSSAYATLDGMVVNTKAAAVYAAFERSLFLSGMLIPTISVPAGSYTAQVPLLDGTITVDTASAGADFATDDITSSSVDALKREVRAKTYAARTILRDIGGVNPTEIGTLLGNKVSAAYDADVMAALIAMTDNTPVATAGALTVAKLFKAAEAIRTAGETGTLFGVVSPAMAYQLMSEVGTSAYAGGDFQTEGLRNGWIGSFAGIKLFQSAYATTNGVIFGEDCARQAAFKGLDVEIARRPAAVGSDVVASLHQGVAVIDGNRGVVLTVA